MGLHLVFPHPSTPRVQWQVHPSPQRSKYNSTGFFLGVAVGEAFLSEATSGGEGALFPPGKEG